jgi:hypothetical protein
VRTAELYIKFSTASSWKFKEEAVRMKHESRDIKELADAVLAGGPIDVNSKAESYALWNRGLFGNKLMTWDSVDDIIRMGYRGTVSMRYKGDIGGGFFKYNVQIGKIPGVCAEWKSEGADLSKITFNESAPDELLILQGYLVQSPAGLTLDYSRKKAKMRDAMAGHLENAEGQLACGLLKSNMTPASYEDMMDLVKLFQGKSVATGNVIEFGIYDCELGCFPNRNSVVWEVRNY